jgi:hypothetical protein
MFCTECGFKNPDLFNFCASCGRKRIEVATPTLIPLDGLSSFKEIAKTISITFLGPDASVIDGMVASSLGQKKSSKLLFNLYASDKFFVVFPASRDKGNMALWGLLLGGGAIGGAAIGALESLSKKLEDRDAAFASEKDDALKKALIFPKEKISLSVKEKRADTGSFSDLYKKETWFLLSGICSYVGKDYDVGVKFGFAGQVSNPNKEKLGILDLICSTLDLDMPSIHTGKNPPF